MGTGKVTLELMFGRSVDNSDKEGSVCTWKGRARNSWWREEREESQLERVTRKMIR